VGRSASHTAFPRSAWERGRGAKSKIPLTPFDKLMTGFDKALLSVAEGLGTNGFHTLQLIFFRFKQQDISFLVVYDQNTGVKNIRGTNR
ncbi:MAG: hypothetical protein Q7U66_14155, partial [Methylobacter sp.]|nr:hypothetical protein [Methylobacter sp.]